MLNSASADTAPIALAAARNFAAFSNERCARVASVAVLDGVTTAALKLGVLNAARRFKPSRAVAPLPIAAVAHQANTALQLGARMHRPRNGLVIVSNLIVFVFFCFTRARPRPSARHAHDDSPATLPSSIARRRPQRRAAPHAVSVVAFVAPPARSRCASGTCARHRNDVERQGRQAAAPCTRGTRRPSGFARTLDSIKRRLPPPMSLVWHHATR